MSIDHALKRPVLYNPALWSRDEVRTYYVARPQLLARFVDDFRREQPGTRPQHRLILGQRGMGKSTLLRRLAIAVDDDTELAAAWLPLVFPEEQYNVATLADFWLNCLDALGDYLESHGRIAEMNAIDAEVERLDRKDCDGALLTLLRVAEKLGRRLLLLVDNIDLILDRLKDRDWALREALQQNPQLLLVGASSRALEASYDYGKAFYDFFRIDELRGLSLEEMRETIVHLARLRGADELIRRLQADPGRLRVLHTLTGGNPRTAVLLYGVLLKGVDGDVRSDLEGLLDEVTPLYKARFDELPAQAQQLLDKLALHWHPMTARQIADVLNWSVNQASAQLDRLVQVGVVEKVKSGRGKRMAFQVAERFFNIWYLMRASRRVRRKLMWLVEFLRVFFNLDELHQHAQTQLGSQCAEPAAAEYMLALGRAMGKVPMARALEMKALGALLAKGNTRLEEVFDLRGEDADLATHAERIQARQAMRVRLQELLADVEGGQALYEGLIGLPLAASELIDFVEKAKGSKDGLRDLRIFVEGTEAYGIKQLGRSAFDAVRQAVASGDMLTLDDVEAGEAAALHLGLPILTCLGRLYYELRHGEGTEMLARTARDYIALEPDGALAWYALGRALLSDRESDREQCIAALRKAIHLAPGETTFVNELAWALVGKAQTKEEARQLFSQVLEAEASNRRAKRGLITASLTDQQARQQIADVARGLCEEEPDVAVNQSLLATVLFGRSGCELEQLRAARRAVELGPEDANGRIWLVTSLLSNQLTEGALLEVRQLFDLLSRRENLAPEVLAALPGLLGGAVKSGVAERVLLALDESGLTDKVLPARAALEAAVAKNVDLLNDVAPEVRQPALVILKAIAPELVGDSDV